VAPNAPAALNPSRLSATAPAAASGRRRRRWWFIFFPPSVRWLPTRSHRLPLRAAPAHVPQAGPQRVVAEDAEAHRDDQDRAADGPLPERRDVRQLQPVLDQPKEEDTDDRSEQAAVAARE